MRDKKFELEITGKTTAYLKLPTHPGTVEQVRNVSLVDVMGAYKGPYVVMDFSLDGVLIGIEVVGDDDPTDEVVELG
jgi:Protein of unknown function (DUF2283)